MAIVHMFFMCSGARLSEALIAIFASVLRSFYSLLSDCTTKLDKTDKDLLRVIKNLKTSFKN